MADVKLPKSVRIGHRNYTIVHWRPAQSAGRGAYGECSLPEAEIRVDTSSGIEKARETLLHEILHAIYYEWAMQDEDKEERIVATYATAITTAMVMNPELRKWFGEVWAK